MLGVTRKAGDWLFIGDDIALRFSAVQWRAGKSHSLQIHIHAPREMEISRCDHYTTEQLAEKLATMGLKP